MQDDRSLELPLRISGDDHRERNDDDSQPRTLFNLFDAGQKQRLFAIDADVMAGAPDPSVAGGEPLGPVGLEHLDARAVEDLHGGETADRRRPA